MKFLLVLLILSGCSSLPKSADECKSVRECVIFCVSQNEKPYVSVMMLNEKLKFLGCSCNDPIRLVH